MPCGSFEVKAFKEFCFCVFFFFFFFCLCFDPINREVDVVVHISTSTTNHLKLFKRFCYMQIKLGGLDFRDKSKSRFIDVSRQTFKNCWDFFNCCDKHLKTVEISQCVETKVYKLLRFFQLLQQTFKNCRDFLDCQNICLKTVEIFSTVATNVYKLLRFFQLLRQTFKNCRDFSMCRDKRL